MRLIDDEDADDLETRHFGSTLNFIDKPAPKPARDAVGMDESVPTTYTYTITLGTIVRAALRVMALLTGAATLGLILYALYILAWAAQ